MSGKITSVFIHMYNGQTVYLLTLKCMAKVTYNIIGHYKNK